MDGWNEAYIRSLYVHRVSNTFELLAASFCFFLARKRIKKKDIGKQEKGGRKKRAGVNNINGTPTTLSFSGNETK